MYLKKNKKKKGKKRGHAGYQCMSMNPVDMVPKPEVIPVI